MMRAKYLTVRTIFGQALVLFCLLGAIAVGAAEKGCLDCHGDDIQAQTLAHRAHGQSADPRLPDGDMMCQSCHGTSNGHREEPRKVQPDRMFGDNSPLNAEERSEICSGCHTGGHQKSWAVSEHASADVACDGCHTVHGLKDPVQEKVTQSQVCLGCHVDQKATALKFSRHPVKEGIVACSDCHNPHGGKGPSMLQEATVNETCYQCHTEKRGPFLWEHEPVQDNCINCHTPHGSVNDNMLQVRMPVLCQQCHNSSSHRGLNHLRDNRWRDLDYNYGKGCLNCHGEVHGSNHAEGGGYFE